ncbi:unnamed protein product [Closterium sp. NIES-53]
MYPKAAAPGVVRLDQIPRWTEQEFGAAALGGAALGDIAIAADLMGLEPPGIGVAPPGLAALDGDPGASSAGVATGASSYATAIASTSSAGDEDPGGFDDPLSAHGLELRGRGRGRGSGGAPKFPVNAELNAKVYVWRGAPWALEVDAVVNSTSESLDPALSSPGLHDEAGPGLAEECATLVRARPPRSSPCRAVPSDASLLLLCVSELSHRPIIPSLQSRHCVLTMLLPHTLARPALLCPASVHLPCPPHGSPGTVRRFLEKHGRGMAAVVFCIQTDDDHLIYKRCPPLLPTCTCSPLAPAPHLHLLPTCTCSPLAPAPHLHLLPTCTCSPLAPAPHLHLLPTCTRSPLAPAPHLHPLPRFPVALSSSHTPLLLLVPVSRNSHSHSHSHSLSLPCVLPPLPPSHGLCRLLPLYFPRDSSEEAAAQSLLPADVGDENGEIVIAERMIRISKMPGLPPATTTANSASTSSALIPAQPPGQLTLSSSAFDDSLLDPAFISMAKDPDQRRVEQREHAVASAQTGWIWLWARCLGLDLGDTVVSLLTAGEQLALHGRYLARAEKLDLTEVQDMRIM